MGGNGYIGWWGSMGGPKQKGITTYVLSPFEQKPFAGLTHGLIFNSTRRVTSQVPYVGVAFAIGYGIYTWAKSRHEYLLSKAGHAEAGDH
ncbi:unnamed protein product [Umbelopsis vinacea]